jgi:hypothetical protein
VQAEVQPLVLAFVATLAFLSPSHAFEVREGECESILSGEARVRIHYASGLKAEVDPVGVDNITSQIDIFPDGRRVPQKWIGGLLPLDAPAGRFAYARQGAIRLLLEVGEARQFPFTYSSAGGRTTSGTITVAVEGLEKAAFGECQATFVTIAVTNNWAHADLSAKIKRLFVKELGFFHRVDR